MPLRPLFLLLVFTAAATGTHAQDVGPIPNDVDRTYAVSSILPSSLANGPDAVVRLDVGRLVVNDVGHAELHVRRAVTVFREDGRSHGRLALEHDRFRTIDELDGRVVDADGETVFDLEDEHVSDHSATLSISLYDDNRVRVAELYHDRYPYTVVYEYVLEYDGYLNFPTWYVQAGDSPVEYGHFEVVSPPSLNLRDTVRTGTLDSALTTKTSWSNGQKVRRWSVREVPAFNSEPYGPPWRQQAASIEVAPTQFRIAGTTGSLASWESFGQWYHELVEGRQDLPADAIARARTLVADAPTRRDSIRRLYEHMQGRTRYISIQLGIGGWQPFPASYVEERSYGDCKALSNYMQALLDAVGIRSHPVLIHAGPNPPSLLPDFPANQFTHMILAVPTEQDTLWLENTSQTMPFAHVSPFISDRGALLVTPEGGKLVRTPGSQATDNRQIRTSTVHLTNDGSGTATVDVHVTGARQDRVRNALVRTSPRDRLKWLRNHVDVPSFDVRNATFDDVTSGRDSITIHYDLSLSRYASKTGPRFFLPLSFVERWTSIPPELETPRTQPVHAFSYPFVDVDSVRYVVPDGYRVEAVPDPVTLETDVGTFTATTTLTDDGVLVYHRRIRVDTATLPPDGYDAFRDFRRAIVRADRAQAVLVQK